MIPKAAVAKSDDRLYFYLSFKLPGLLNKKKKGITCFYAFIFADVFLIFQWFEFHDYFLIF